MGTPDFACPILEALLARRDPVVAVVTRPDRARGRGLATGPPEVKRVAERHAIPVLQPEKLRDPGFEDALRRADPDLVVVAAYGRILPRTLLDLPRHGCVNVHASLLPRHRGAAPITWAILCGDRASGITIMAMNEQMDAGDILLQRDTPIAADETAGTLGERLAHLGAEAIGEAIDGLQDGSLSGRPQPPTGVTFAPRIEPEDCRLDWSRSALELERRVRALAPTPAAFTTVGGRRLKVHRARADAGGAGAPGTVIDAGVEGLLVATGAGTLRLLDVQLEGRRRMSVGEFLSGHRVDPGACLGTG
jgi:methionyl-tRNA formyltransferase